jgi:hypothetical protein
VGEDVFPGVFIRASSTSCFGIKAGTFLYVYKLWVKLSLQLIFLSNGLSNGRICLVVNFGIGTLKMMLRSISYCILDATLMLF